MFFLLAVEHVRAEVQHSAFVHFGCLPISVEIGLIVHYKLVDTFDHINFIHLLLELVLTEIGESNQEMHEHTDFHRLPNRLQDTVHQVDSLIRFADKVDLTPLGMYNIGKHGRGEVQAKHMDLDGCGSLDQFEHPVDDIVVQVRPDDGLLY